MLEGIKVLTMCWGILTATSLYVLTLSCRNLYVMLELFNQYLFCLVSSGNLSPDLFIYMIYFIGFVKLSQFYDNNRGIGIKNYGKLYAHRYLKIAPLYYFVFFTFWLLLPLLSTRANWYLSERLFTNCEEQVPFILTFLNNLVPFFTKALEGCYYWPYIVSNDLLLYTFFPLWVIIYKKSKVVFYVLNTFFLMLGIFLSGFIAYKYNLTVGILTFEDYYLYAYQFNKPYMKFVATSCGMFTGLFYLRLLEYRQATDRKKIKEYSWIHFMKNSKIMSVVLFVYGMGMLSFSTSIPLTANQDSYSWTSAQNVAFF